MGLGMVEGGAQGGEPSARIHHPSLTYMIQQIFHRPNRKQLAEMSILLVSIVHAVTLAMPLGDQPSAAQLKRQVAAAMCLWFSA